MQRMTRAQLRVWALEHSENAEWREDWGCLCPKGYPAPTLKESEEYGVPSLSFQAINDFQTTRLRTIGKSLKVASNGTPVFPDPTRDIEEAWKLLPLLVECWKDEGKAHIVYDFERTLLALMYSQESQSSCATLICQTAYYAVEGTRVEVME